MKCTGISAGNSSKDSLTLAEFLESDLAATLLGKLLISLTGEAVWSSDYTIYASFGSEKPFLQIMHPIFVPEGSLMIYDDGKTVLSVREVEDAVRKHIRNSQGGIRPAISMLQNKVNDLGRLSEKITWDKARAAIIAVFPQAATATPSHVGIEADLYAFHENYGTGPVFIAREIDGEFIGGTACIECNGFDWYAAGNGCKDGQRHYRFWAALARAFVAREFSISEKDLWHQQVFASEKPWEFPQSDPYTVEKVVLQDRKGGIVVEFGSDNLPETVTVLTAEQEEPAVST